jgi:O-antigen ligase
MNVAGVYRGAAGRIKEALRFRNLPWTMLLVALASMIFSVAMAQTAVIAAGIAWVVNLLRGETKPVKMNIIVIAYLAFIAARILSVATSINPSGSARILYTEIPFNILFFIALTELRLPDTKRMETIFTVIFWAAILSTAIGVAKAIAFGETRISSTTSGYYTLGMFLCLALLIVFTIGAAPKLNRPGWLWMLGCITIAMGLLLTQNRLHWATATILALAVGLVRHRRSLLILVPAVFALIVISPQLVNRFQEQGGISSDASGRDIIFKGALTIADDRPLTGFGPRTFREVFPLIDRLRDTHVASWHNDYMQVYFDSGLLALLPFLLIVAMSLWWSWKTARLLGRQHPMSGVNLAIGIGLLAFALAGGMIDTLLSIPYRILLAAAVLMHQNAGLIEYPVDDSWQTALRNSRGW